MSESTTINLIVTGLLLPVIGMLVWLIKTAVNYFFKDGGFMDDMRGSTKEWFTAQKDYMESSRVTQAGTAAAAAATALLLEQHAAAQVRHVSDMARHDVLISKQTLESHEVLGAIAARQLEHGDHLKTLVIAGTRACEVAAGVCEKLELGTENVVAIEKIKESLAAKVKDDGGD